jgi:hypothetical protein
VLRAAIAELYFGPHRDQQLALGFNVADLRDVFEDDLILGQDGSGHAGQR